MTDYKQLCAELLEWAERTSGHYYKQADVIIRARALLDQPESQPPAAGEVAELVEGLKLISDGMSAIGHESDSWFVARAAELLQRQHPQPQPVAVSERLPNPEDCDAEGRCWAGTRASVDATGDRDVDLPPAWELREVCAQDDVWLPTNALPTPEAS